MRSLAASQFEKKRKSQAASESLSESVSSTDPETSSDPSTEAEQTVSSSTSAGAHTPDLVFLSDSSVCTCILLYNTLLKAHYKEKHYFNRNFSLLNLFATFCCTLFLFSLSSLGHHVVLSSSPWSFSKPLISLFSLVSYVLLNLNVCGIYL